MVHEKKIIDEISNWLRIFEDGSVDRSWIGPPEAMFMVESIPPHEEFINGVATRDVTIGKPFNLRVRLYLPELKSPEKNQKLPIILHFHGGGFCVSQPDWFIYYQIYTRLSSSIKAIIVSVYLRLAPENRLPAAIDDSFLALLWLQSLAKDEITNEPWLKEYGDFKRVFLIGDSSGGNIVHEVATRASEVDLCPMRLAGAIPIHPGFVRSTRSRSELEQHSDSPFLTLAMIDKLFGLSLPIGSNKDHPITCPMGSGAPPLESLKLPPMLLCLAEKDLILDTEMDYYEGLKKGGKDVEILMSFGMVHAFHLNKIAMDMNPAAAAQADELIAKHKTQAVAAV